MTFNVVDRKTGLLWDPTPERRVQPERREKPRLRRGRRVEDLISDLELLAAWEGAFEDAPGSTIWG